MCFFFLGGGRVGGGNLTQVMPAFVAEKILDVVFSPSSIRWSCARLRHVPHRACDNVDPIGNSPGGWSRNAWLASWHMADVYPQNSRVIWFDSSSLIIHPVLKTLKYDLDVEKDSPYISYPILREGLLLLSTSRYIHRLPLDLTSSCKNKAYTEDSQAYNQSRQPHHSLNMRFQTARGKSVDVKSDWEISCFYSFCSTKKKSKRIGSMFSCFTTSSPWNTTFWGGAQMEPIFPSL